MDAVLARLEDAKQRGDVAAVVVELRAYGGSPAHALVALWACAAVCALTNTAAPADNSAKAVAAGAIKTLLHTLRVHGADAAVQTGALWALYHVLTDAVGVGEASRRGAVDTVMAALHAHAAVADAQAAGFGVLNFLLHFAPLPGGVLQRGNRRQQPQLLLHVYSSSIDSTT
jgi:hypothetical protein